VEIGPPSASSPSLVPTASRPARAWLVVLVAALSVLAACGGSSSESTPEGPSAIVVTDPVMPEPAGTSGAVYMTITNTGGTDDRLLSAEAEASDMVMLHRTEIDDEGRATMDEAGPLTVPAGGEAVLEPGGDHLMLDVPDGLAVGDTYEVTLVFEEYGDVTIDVEVVATEDVLS
jgi:periplasmic copper chaperone A